MNSGAPSDRSESSSHPEGPSGRATDRAGTELVDRIEHVTLVFIGLISVVLAVIVLANPALSVDKLLFLLAGAVALNSVRTIIAGGHLLRPTPGGWSIRAWGWRAYRELGILGIGLIAVGLAALAALDPSLALAAAVFLLAVALIAQGIGRIMEGSGTGPPNWLRSSGMATGAIIVTLVVASLAFEGLAVLGFAILVGVILLISGIETVVTGLHPTDPRQFVLLKLLLFAAFYGLVMINWIDLFGKVVPGYGIWLVLSYMAPFGVLLVFEGWEAWPLATSLGLLVSLMNDVGYFFIGNLLFGFHEPLGPWISGQLGFEGNRIVTTFDAGAFNINVTSWMMGLSIYARAVVVALILLYWWRHPGMIVARGVATPTPGAT